MLECLQERRISRGLTGRLGLIERTMMGWDEASGPDIFRLAEWCYYDDMPFAQSFAGCAKITIEKLQTYLISRAVILIRILCSGGRS